MLFWIGFTALLILIGVWRVVQATEQIATRLTQVLTYLQDKD